ncbi:MAG: hypothetical protein ACKO0Z_01795 [Betaproteobacteria bacterium]
MKLTIDDFEWVQDGFDVYVLTHKVKDFPVGRITNFNGWVVNVWKANRRDSPLVANALDLDAAKMVGTLHAAQHMEEYSAHFNKHPNAYPKRKRDAEFRPETFPRGVFKVD